MTVLFMNKIIKTKNLIYIKEKYHLIMLENFLEEMKEKYCLMGKIK